MKCKFVSCPVNFLVFGKGLMNVTVPPTQQASAPASTGSHLMLVSRCPGKLRALAGHCSGLQSVTVGVYFFRSSTEGKCFHSHLHTHIESYCEIENTEKHTNTVCPGPSPQTSALRGTHSLRILPVLPASGTHVLISGPHNSRDL